jgi:hypothetical protein
MYSGMTRLEQLLAYLNECGEPKTARQVAQYFKNNTKIFDYKTETQLQGEFNHEVTEDLKVNSKHSCLFITTGYPRKISLREYKAVVQVQNPVPVVEVQESENDADTTFKILKIFLGDEKNKIFKYKGESIKVSM